MLRSNVFYVDKIFINYDKGLYQVDITRATEKLLLQIMEHCNEQGICDVDYWENRFETLSSVEDELLRDQFKELKDAGLVNTAWASDVPYQISIKNKGGTTKSVNWK